MKLLSPTRVVVAVGVVFGCLMARADAAPEPADFIIFNAKVVTVSSNFETADALAVRGGKIVAVGRNWDMVEFKGPGTRLVNAEGRTVLPGIYDGEVNSYAASVSEFDAVPPVISSIAEAQEYIRKRAAVVPKGGWIVLERLYPTRMKEGRLPTLKELDAAAPEHPVLWDCGPLAVVNSAALTAAKINDETQNPPGGELVRDRKTHQPTGLLRNATSLLKLSRNTRVPTSAQRREALKRLYQLYNQQGITSVGEVRAEPAAIDLFREMAAAKELTARIDCTRTVQLGRTLDESIARLDALTNVAKGKLPLGPTGTGDDWVRIGALKTVIDGDLAVGTAYLRTPWGIGPTYQNTEPAYRGQTLAEPMILNELYLEAAQRGWQLTGQCAGDAALDSLMNAYQYIQYRTNITERRFLVSRADFQNTQAWKSCQHLGTGAEMQPVWLYKDGSSLEKTLGDKRMKWFMPLKTWFGQGIVIGGGSDHETGLDSFNSVSPWSPWLGMWVALTRETEQGVAIHPEECLTREQAIRFYTFNNAWLHFQENSKGSLETGKLADFIMIDRDILNCPVDDVRETKVLLTMVGGKVVWESQPWPQGVLVFPEATSNGPKGGHILPPPAPVVVPAG